LCEKEAAIMFKVTTLSENHIAQGSRNLVAEHGLCFCVETGDRRILFDTGQNLAIANNAGVLKIDLGRIDTVVLSHGHYDHSGGLKSLLACNPDFTLVAHPDVFGHKLKGADASATYIGIPVEKKLLVQKGVKLTLGSAPVEIAPGIMTTGEIPLENNFEAVESGFFLKRDYKIAPDTLADDRALILDTDKGLVVLLGCSHRGVVNTLNHVLTLTGLNRIHAVLGGLHLGKASDAKLKEISNCLRDFGLERIGVGHCTGPRAFLALSNELNDKVFLNTVGNVIMF